MKKNNILKSMRCVAAAWCVMAFSLLAVTEVRADDATADEACWWYYESLYDWQERGDTIAGYGYRWVFYWLDADDDYIGSPIVERGGKSYRVMHCFREEIRPTAPQRAAQAGAPFAELGVRSEGGRVYVDRDNYQDYLSRQGYLACHCFGDSGYVPYPVTDDGELMLYDYTVEQGGVYAHAADGGDIVVTAKDMVTLSDGQEHRRLTLSNGKVVIEGVGCVNGFLLDYLNPSAAYAKEYTYLTYVERCSGMVYTMPEKNLDVDICISFGDGAGIDDASTAASSNEGRARRYRLDGVRQQDGKAWGIYVDGLGRKHIGHR